MAYAAMTTEVTGTLVTATKWNVIVDNFAHLASMLWRGTAFSSLTAGTDIMKLPSCGVYNSANISIPNGAATAITWNSEDWDNDSMHSTSSNTSRLIATKTGVYTLDYRFYAAGGLTWIFTIRVNGATAIFADNDFDTIFSRSISIKLTANDYVEILAQHNGGGANNITYTINESPKASLSWKNMEA